MEKVEEIKKRCVGIIKNAPELIDELKNYCVYEEKEIGQRVYLKAYIPFIGNKYGKVAKILFFCTAQNLAGNRNVLKKYASDDAMAIHRLYYRRGNGLLWVDVGPVAGGVLPALVGILLLLLDNKRIEDLEECVQYMAFTNFYKFSLQTKELKDLNPNNLDIRLKETYDNFMLEKYIKYEIEALSPDYIFCFKPFYEILKDYLEKNKLNIRLFLINDPAWLLRGARGIKRWEEKISKTEKTDMDHQIEGLIDSYCEYIRKKDPHPNPYYQKKTKQIRIYLKYYYYKLWRDEECVKKGHVSCEISGIR